MQMLMTALNIKMEENSFFSVSYHQKQTNKKKKAVLHKTTIANVLILIANS